MKKAIVVILLALCYFLALYFYGLALHEKPKPEEYGYKIRYDISITNNQYGTHCRTYIK